MKNIGPREGGSITAAQFLKRYVEDGVAWAHLDIAGMAWGDKDGPVYAKGATGYGVRLPDRYIAANHEGCYVLHFVIASDAKQSRAVYANSCLPPRFRLRNDGGGTRPMPTHHT